MPHHSRFDQGLCLSELSVLLRVHLALTSCVTLQGEGFLEPDPEVLMGASGAEEHTAASCLIFAEQDFSITWEFCHSSSNKIQFLRVVLAIRPSCPHL